MCGALWRNREMERSLRALAAACVLFGVSCGGTTALAQKSGGVLKVYFFDSPASMSIHEEATISTVAPVMSVFKSPARANRAIAGTVRRFRCQSLSKPPNAVK